MKLLKLVGATTFSLSLSFSFSAAVALAGEHAHWSYGRESGPEKWGDLEKDFAGCKLGKEQSPIDISSSDAKKVGLSAIKTAYKSSAGELLNNGHTIQINLGEGGSATVLGRGYKLLQFHFHTPSEEKIDGKSFPLVAHLVHKSADGKLAVIAVLFNEGKENAALKEIFNVLPAKEGKSALKAAFNVSTILPASMAYYAFKGSLTTPPCSEGVAWQVLKTPVEMSAAQLAAFRKIFPMNARPVQALNGREVLAAD